MIHTLLRRLTTLSLTSLFAGTLSAQILAPAGLSITNQNATFDAFGGSPSMAVTPSSLSRPEVYQPFQQSATPPQSQHGWKTDIVATIFWVGELPTQNNPVPNTASSWDPRWTNNFGGYDDPDPEQRGTDFRPAKFTPKENPFYFALPYNDVVNHKTTKEEAGKIIPWYKSAYTKAGRSVCRNRWIAIQFGDRTCYAQWGDCGPFVTDDADYVFGSARPSNSKNNGAGLDISPAVRDFLGFKSGQKCHWKFVEDSEVPDGPWKNWGTNNPFSREGRARLAGASASTVAARGNSSSTISTADLDRITELRRQRDLWFQNGGAARSGR